jgi:hypothetical protein
VDINMAERSGERRVGACSRCYHIVRVPVTPYSFSAPGENS